MLLKALLLTIADDIRNMKVVDYLLWLCLILSIIGSIEIPNGDIMTFGDRPEPYTMNSMKWFVCNSLVRVLLIVSVYLGGKRILTKGLVLLAMCKLVDEFFIPYGWSKSEQYLWPIVAIICVYLWCEKKSAK